MALGPPEKQQRDYISLYRSDAANEAEITEDLVQYLIHVIGPKFGNFHAQCEKAFQYYQLEFDPQMPQGSRAVRLPTFRDRINTAVAQITAGYVDISVPPRRISSRGVAERTEKFLTRAREMMERQNAQDEIMLIHMMLYGVAFKKIEFNIRSMLDLPELPERPSRRASKQYMDAIELAMDSQAGKLPIDGKVLDPTEMYWDLANPNPVWMVWRTKRPMSWVQAMFPEWGRDDEAGEAQLDVYEIWTKDQVAYWCNDKWAMAPRTHEYGMIPILMAKPTLSVDNQHHRPEERHRGLGHGVYELLEMESRMASMFVDIAEKSAWPAFEVHGNPTQARGVREKYSTRPNAINHIPPGVDVARVDVGEAPRSLLEGRTMLQDAINTSIFTSVASRRPENGPSSGYQTAVLQGIASLNLTPTMLAYKRVLESQNELVLRIVENVIRGSLTVAGVDMDGASLVSLHADDIRGYYANIVELNAMSPDEQERKARLWSDMYRVGWVDHRYSLTQGGVQNPHAVMLAVQMEMIQKSDPVTFALIQQVLGRIPYLSQQLDAVGELSLAEQTRAQEAAYADAILNSQGSTQLANPGNFQPGNSQGNTPNTPGSGQPGTVRPVIPGSPEEANLTARQFQNIPGQRV